MWYGSPEASLPVVGTHQETIPSGKRCQARRWGLHRLARPSSSEGSDSPTLRDSSAGPPPRRTWEDYEVGKRPWPTHPLGGLGLTPRSLPKGGSPPSTSFLGHTPSLAGED